MAQPMDTTPTHGPASNAGPAMNQAQAPTPVNVVLKDFDLESYINNYSGHTKIARLIFIAEHCKDLELDAYRLAIDELKKTTNTTLYKEVAEKVGNRLGAAYALDQAWIDATEKRSQQKLERLELELNAYRTSLIKESIRNGYNDLGDLHYDRGDLNAALKCYVRTRDYCTNPKHIIQMCLNVIKVSIEMGNFAHVVNYVNKAEQTPELTDKPTIALLKICAGLSHLENRKYKVAATKFLEATFDINNQYTDIVAAQDVAVYGGLTALATFDRSELKKKVLDNPQFKNFLELAPRVREMISDFYASRYASCLNYMEQIKSELLIDIHLHDHVRSLYEKIRSKALVQYFSPFTSVNLNTMAEAFNTNVAGLEKELAALIIEGAISGRIDSHNKVLYARTVNQRSTTFDAALRMGNEYQKDTKTLLLRINMLKKDFVVRPPRKEDVKEK